MHIPSGIKSVKDARFAIELYNFEAKAKIFMGAALGIFYGALAVADPSMVFYCGASYACPLIYCLIQDGLEGGQKEYQEAKKTLDSLLC
jgi:hypothetical protein